MNTNFSIRFWSQIQFLSRGCIVCKLALLFLFLYVNEAKSQDAYFPQDIGESNVRNYNINNLKGTFSQNLKRSLGRFIPMLEDNPISDCSCNLVNTVKQNRATYVFTAAHCLRMLNINEAHKGYFSFDFEMADAFDRGDPNRNHSISGMWAVTYNIVFKNRLSDIALLELIEYPPELLENAYAAGWDNSLYSNTVFQNISHPAGDVKKFFFKPSFTHNFLVDQNSTEFGSSKRSGIFYRTFAPWDGVFTYQQDGSSGSGVFSKENYLMSIHSSSNAKKQSTLKFSHSSSILNNWKAPDANHGLAQFLDQDESYLNRIPGGYLNDLVSVTGQDFSLEVGTTDPNHPTFQTPFHYNNNPRILDHENMLHVKAFTFFPVNPSSRPIHIQNWFYVKGIQTRSITTRSRVVLSVWYPYKKLNLHYGKRLLYGSYRDNPVEISDIGNYGFVAKPWNCDNPPEGFPPCNRRGPFGVPFTSGFSTEVKNPVLQRLKELSEREERVIRMQERIPIVVQLDNIGDREAKVNAISYPGEGPLNALQLFRPDALKNTFNYYKYKESRGKESSDNYFIAGIKVELQQYVSKGSGTCTPLPKKVLSTVNTNDNGGYLNLVNHLHRIKDVVASDPACTNQKNKLIITIFTPNTNNKHYGAWLDYDRARIGGGQSNPDDNYTYDFKIDPSGGRLSEQLAVGSTKKIAVRIEHEVPTEIDLASMFGEDNKFKTRLRVAIAKDQEVAQDGIYDFGEVEDYLIEIRKTSDEEKAEARREAIFDKISVARGKQLPNNQNQSGNNDQQLPNSGGSSTAFGGVDDAPVQNTLPLVSFSDNPDLQSFLVTDNNVVEVGTNAFSFDGLINMLIGGATGGGGGGYDPYAAKSTVSHYYELIPDLEPVCEDPSVCGPSSRSGINNASNANSYQIVIDEGGGRNGFSLWYNSEETVYGVKINGTLETCTGPGLKHDEREKILHSFDEGVMKLIVGGETVTNDKHKIAGNLTILENTEGASIGGVSGEGTIWNDNSENINMHAKLDYVGATYKVLNDEEIVALGVLETSVKANNAKRLRGDYPPTSKNSKEEVEKKETDFSIFPNPAKTELNILIEVSNAGSLYIGIYDLSGKRVYETKEPHINEGHQLITLRKLKFSAGQYVVKIKAGNVTKSEQVVFE